MRYRALDADGDMTFGQGGLNFLVNEPAAVAQAVKTRLRLDEGEWFLDLTEGTPYETQVLGYGTRQTRDVAIRDRILGTPGLTDIVTYSSSVDVARKFTVNGTANTLYGEAPIQVVV